MPEAPSTQSLELMGDSQPTTVLFTVGALRVVELGARDIPRLQCFLELNPEYYFAVSGQPPSATEAHEEIHGALPEGWPFSKKWILGVLDETDSLVGMANVVADLLAPGVWHIGLFVVATRLHGKGVAHSLFAQLESWMLASGARWLRLGVVEGNLRAERFWERLAFREVRKRGEVKMGRRVNTLRVMAKPLAGGTPLEYLTLVARDRPEPPGRGHG